MIYSVVKLCMLCIFFVTTGLPKLEKLLVQLLKDARDNSIPLVHQFN